MAGNGKGIKITARVFDADSMVQMQKGTIEVSFDKPSITMRDINEAFRKKIEEKYKEDYLFEIVSIEAI